MVIKGLNGQVVNCSAKDYIVNLLQLNASICLLQSNILKAFKSVFEVKEICEVNELV